MFHFPRLPSRLKSRDDGISLPPGCPIRVPPDHGLLAAPRGVSSLATPFFGCGCQGIHRAPLFTCPPPIATSTKLSEEFFQESASALLPQPIHHYCFVKVRTGF